MNLAASTLAAFSSIAVASTLLLTSNPVNAADLGRIFFSPSERNELEAKRAVPPKPRDVGPRPTPIATAPPLVTEPPAPPPPVTLNGHVVSSSGRSTTWINSVPNYDTYRIGNTSQIAVPTGDGNRRVPLKVGQTFDSETGVADRAGAKAVSVQRR
jgi:hypothetical protein